MAKCATGAVAISGTSPFHELKRIVSGSPPFEAWLIAVSNTRFISDHGQAYAIYISPAVCDPHRRPVPSESIAWSSGIPEQLNSVRSHDDWLVASTTSRSKGSTRLSSSAVAGDEPVNIPETSVSISLPLMILINRNR